jgi:ribosomal protection tetracycline resistance protein
MQTLNLGILAHVDAGKTSLTERLLFDNGSIARLGAVDAGSTQTDSGEIERQRGITIRSAVASFSVGGLQVNLIDTPGHPDFIAEVERALAVLDGAVLVLSAVEGVQAQTRVLMKSLRKLRLPTLIFVNKIDRMGARSDDLLADIRARLAPGILTMSSVQDPGTPAARAVPRPLHQRDTRARLAETLAENDDALLTRLLADSVPARGELTELIAGQTAAAQLSPVFFGSALSGAGCRELTDGIATLLRPAPEPNDDLPVRGTVFAIERGSSGEKLAYLRLFSGELRERQRVTLWRPETGGQISEFAGQVTGLEIIGERPSAADTRRAPGPGRAHPYRARSARRRLTAGSIGRIRGLSRIRVGDQLGPPSGTAPGPPAPGSPAPGPPAPGRSGQPHFPPPSLETIVRAREPGQAGRLHAALLSLADEDPLIQARAAGGGATSVLLYGAVQQEVIAARLERDFGVTPVFEAIRPVYFERPAGVGEASEEISRHGPNDYLATIGLRVEPTALGAGLSFSREVELGSLPRAFHAAIEEATRRTLEQGLQGWEVTDCAVTLIRSGYSAPVSVAADFRDLTPLVLMRALQAAGSQVYEPCHSFEAEVPGDVLSAVIGHLGALEADITQSAEAGASWLVTGEIPARLVQDFTKALPGLTRGEGVWWSRPGGDRPVRGRVPVRGRYDGNPLNRDEYRRFLARGSSAAGL